MAASGLKIVLLLLLTFGSSSCLQWITVTGNQTHINACADSNVVFPTAFSLDDGEEIVDIKWLNSPDGTSVDLIANYIYGHFEAWPPFSQRLSYAGNGSLEIAHVTLRDSGSYVIEVSSHKNDRFAVARHTLVVVVAEPPSSDAGRLSLQQEQQALFDNTTNSYHVQLKCGPLTSRGTPPLDVVWTTPSGSQEPSSNTDAFFSYLTLPNPPTGGNYSCQLPPLSSSAGCLPGDSPLLGAASVVVDAVAARLTLLEARDEVLNNMLKESTENNRLLKEQLNNVTSGYAQENQILRQLDNATSRIDDLERILEQCHCQNRSHASPASGTSSRQVYFHARGNDAVHVNAGQHISFTNQYAHVFANQGNAFNTTTSEFVVPFDGVYAFLLTMGVRQEANSYGDVYLILDGSVVNYVFEKTNGFYPAQATTHAVLHLRAGQRVWVQSTQNLYLTYATVFSGFLLGAD